jgi:hypothetical protein
MRFNLGDIVHNKITQEEGRIVRIADNRPEVVAYIVSVALDPQIWRTPTKEALWPESQIST